MLKLNFFNSHPSHGFVSLLTGRVLQLASWSLLGLFLPVYLLVSFGGKLEYVFYFFLAGGALYIVLLPWGAQLMNRIGLRRSLRLSVIAFAAYYICLFLLERNLILYLSLATASVVLARIFFWLPFHTNMAEFTDKSNRGKDLGLLYAAFIFLSVAMPAISGFIISRWGYSIVFILAITIHLCSFVPFLTLPSTHEKFSWNYRETVKQFFALKNRKLVLSNIAYGAESDVAMIMWPIFIWQLFKGDYFAVGFISSLIVLTAVVFQLFIGDCTDNFNKRKLMHWGSVLSAVGWLAKIFVISPVHVFIVGAYHNFTQIFKDTPFDALNYELLADQGHFVDEYTVLKEIAIWLGKIMILVAAVFVAANFGLNWTFALAAIAALLVNLF